MYRVLMFTFAFGRRATLHFVRERLVGVGTCGVVGVCSNVGGREGGGVGGSIVVCVGLISFVLLLRVAVGRTDGRSDTTQGKGTVGGGLVGNVFGVTRWSSRFG